MAERYESKTYSVDRVAELLGLSRAAMYQAVHRRQIYSVRIGNRILIPRSAVEKLLEGEVSDMVAAVSSPT